MSAPLFGADTGTSAALLHSRRPPPAAAPPRSPRSQRTREPAGRTWSSGPAAAQAPRRYRPPRRTWRGPSTKAAAPGVPGAGRHPRDLLLDSTRPARTHPEHRPAKYSQRGQEQESPPGRTWSGVARQRGPRFRDRQWLSCSRRGTPTFQSRTVQGLRTAGRGGAGSADNPGGAQQLREDGARPGDPVAGGRAGSPGRRRAGTPSAGFRRAPARRDLRGSRDGAPLARSAAVLHHPGRRGRRIVALRHRHERHGAGTNARAADFRLAAAERRPGDLCGKAGIRRSRRLPRFGPGGSAGPSSLELAGVATRAAPRARRMDRPAGRRPEGLGRRCSSPALPPAPPRVGSSRVGTRTREHPTRRTGFAAGPVRGRCTARIGSRLVPQDLRCANRLRSAGQLLRLDDGNTVQEHLRAHRAGRPRTLPCAAGRGDRETLAGGFGPRVHECWGVWNVREVRNELLARGRGDLGHGMEQIRRELSACPT